ncbi:MAG: hypothetical protein LC640_13645 [Frankia sp.]|nr:hypothetical protein [Frankia sp.]
MLLILGVGFATQPFVTELVDRREVQQAYESLRLPDGWTATQPAVVQVPRRGAVLLSAPYRRQDDARANLSSFVDAARSQGWEMTDSGAPDLSTAILRKGDVFLAAAVLDSAGVVRVEVSRVGSVWW